MCRLFLLWQTVATRIVKGNNYMSFILWNIFALLISDVSTIINLCCTRWRRCLYLTSKSKRCNLLLLILFYSIESLLLQLLLLSICLSFLDLTMISICMLRVSIFREKCGCLHLQFTVTSKNTVFSTSNPMDTRKSFQNISEALLGMASVRMRSSEFRHYFSTPTSLWSVSVYLNVWPVRQSLSLTCLIFDSLLVFVTSIWYVLYVLISVRMRSSEFRDWIFCSSVTNISIS